MKFSRYEPVPDEQLYDPVRVCDDCGDKNSNRTGSGANGGRVRKTSEMEILDAIEANEEVH